MNKIAISFAVGASALFATAATAAPLTVNPSVAPDSNIQNVRMVCNENGRCWRERGERRVVQQCVFEWAYSGMTIGLQQELRAIGVTGCNYRKPLYISHRDFGLFNEA